MWLDMSSWSEVILLEGLFGITGSRNFVVRWLCVLYNFFSGAFLKRNVDGLIPIIAIS